ncbi:MAG: hypothetical protein IJT54_06105 [Candidatus Methanomethylophilaceae archaeon]|nr:hypothetical protein [Candidatus Methanomethylophilaceae archaeon]
MNNTFGTCILDCRTYDYHLRGHLLKHTDSWDAIRYQKDAVVGYASMVFE